MRLIKLINIATLLTVVFSSSSLYAAAISGDVRGVTFFYLDGGSQDFPWVLDNQDSADAALKINNLLGEYKRAGVNWVRLLVAGNHRAEWRQPPTNATVAKLNAFLSKLNQQGLLVEIVLIPPVDDNTGMFDSSNAFASSKTWLDGWISRINYANVGMIMLGGDLQPCRLSGCEGDPAAEALPKNHGAYIRAIWAWKQAVYPNIYASYEAIGLQIQSNNSPALIGMLAKWADKNTPGLPTLGASFYIDLPNGSSWTAYAYAIDLILQKYQESTARPLWIDEYGSSYVSTNPANTRTENDQKSAFEGFLGSSVCWHQNRYPKFAWIAGNDWPYDGFSVFRLVRGFTSGGKPDFTSAWNTVSQYYNLATCP